MRPRGPSGGALLVAYFDTSMLLELKPRHQAGTHRRARSRPGAADPLVQAPTRPYSSTREAVVASDPAPEPDFSPQPTPAAPKQPGVRLWRYLPLTVLTTALVILAPAAVVAALVPHSGLAMTLVSALAAMALSLLLATAAAALWKRQPRSRDVVFSDLTLWGWVRRYRAESRLSQARELFESARRAGPLVNVELLLGLSRLLEARDPYIHGHSQRVARHAVRIARKMGLCEREVAKLRTAAEVHDVGKLYTPRKVLNNPERLTDWEFAVIKEHAARGAEMVSVVGDPEITAMVRHHHERIDGGGYPDGLTGSQIPLGARIIAVADTFDAITSDRPYRAARSQKRALDILRAEGGAQLDADAVAAFVQGYSARRSVGCYAFTATAAERAAAALQSVISGLGAGGASLATLAPALGAAGVLAVSPGLFRVSHSSQAPGGASALLQPLVAAGEGASPAKAQTPAARARRGAHGGTGRPSAGLGPSGGRQRVARAPAAGSTPAGSLGAGAVTRGATTAGDGGSGGSGSGGSPPKAPTPSPLPPVTGTPTIPTPPPVPPVTVPSVSTPTVSTPAVTTPVATVPSVTVPSVTVPQLPLHP